MVRVLLRLAGAVLLLVLRVVVRVVTAAAAGAVQLLDRTGTVARVERLAVHHPVAAVQVFVHAGHELRGREREGRGG